MRAAEQFVSGERDNVYSGFEDFPGCGFVFHTVVFGVDERAATEIFDNDESFFLCQRDQLFPTCFFCEANDLIIARVYFQQDTSLIGNRVCVVPHSCFISCADFDEFGFAAFNDFRNPEGAADFYEFAA